MAWGLTLLSPPASEPVSLPEAKDWMRVDIGDDDALIQSLVTAARQHAEDLLGRQFVTATWRLSLDCFPGGRAGWGALLAPWAWDRAMVRLPKAPLQSVSSATYYDLAGTLQTLPATAYDADPASDPGRLSLAFGQSWPVTRPMPGAVRIDFVAGYGAAAQVPEGIKTAIKLLAAHWYENREAVVTGTIASKIPLAVESLLASQSNGEYR